MKTHLLIAIRYVRKREREAMAQRGATSWLLRNSRLWRIFQYLAVMPLNISRMTGFHVRSDGLASSKGELTRSVLLQAGVDASLLQPRVSPNTWLRVRKAARLLARAPITAQLALGLWGRLQRSTDDIGIIIATILLQRMLESNPHLVPVINSDLSPEQVMLACAAQGIGRRAVWWQDDFHYTEAVPFHVSAGVVLNRNGLGALQARNPDALIFRRYISMPASQRQAESIMKIPPRARYVGVAVNGLFTGKEDELEVLSRIRKTIGVDQLELRLHPTANFIPENLPSGVQISPQDESVQEFSSRMDIVFSGNSAIQYKVLLSGTPVLHVPGLDSLEFDMYGYVTKGLIFGSRNVDNTLLERAFSFYRNSSFAKRLNAHEAEQFDIPGEPLSEIMKLLRR